MARERYLLNAGEDTIHQNEIKLVTAKDKRKNWWYYNKRILAAVILVSALVIYFAYSILSKVEPDYTIGLLTSYSMPDNGLKELERCITPYADDRNGDGQVVVDVVNYAYSGSSTADPTAQQAAMIRFWRMPPTTQKLFIFMTVKRSVPWRVNLWDSSSTQMALPCRMMPKIMKMP